MNNLISRTLIVLSLSLFLFANSSCKKENTNTQLEIKKVAMLAGGYTFDDMGFLQSCKDGMEKAKNEFDLEVEYSVDTLTDNFQERIDSFGDQGFDLIISIGFMWNDAVINASKKYPKIKFIIVDTELSEAQTNALSILFDVDEVAYPLGFLSAWWADKQDGENPKLGYVGAMEIPQIKQFIEPFINGSLRYNQQYGRNVETIGTYADSFFNMDFGKHLADSLINDGADIIFGVGSETGNGALIKAAEHEIQGIGVDVDQYYSFPEVSDILISSAMKGLDNAIYDVVASLIDEGFFSNGLYTGNLANIGVGMAPFHNYKDMISDSIKLELTIIETGIIDGSISTGW